MPAFMRALFIFDRIIAMHDDQNIHRGKIGIPKALLWWRYGIFWETFLRDLGQSVIVSGETDRKVFEAGEHASTDEVCLASKIYLGHVASLIGKCDAVFVPNYSSDNIRAGFCTKYQSLPDMVRATFRNDIEVLDMQVSDAHDVRKTARDFYALGEQLGAHPAKVRKAVRHAFKMQNAANQEKAAALEETFRLLETYRRLVKQDASGGIEAPLAIMLVAHPYIAHDQFVSRDIVSAIEEAGATVVFADAANPEKSFKRSFEFSETLPWIINRELAGAVLANINRIDGIVIVSAYPCGPDSMFSEELTRYVHESDSGKNVPVLNLMIDNLSGSAGIQTRVESFMDILRFRERGAYLE